MHLTEEPNLKEAARAIYGDATDQLFQLYGFNTDADVMGQPGNRSENNKRFS
jgi:hypothetical protein